MSNALAFNASWLFKAVKSFIVGHPSGQKLFKITEKSFFFVKNYKLTLKLEDLYFLAKNV